MAVIQSWYMDDSKEPKWAKRVPEPDEADLVDEPPKPARWVKGAPGCAEHVNDHPLTYSDGTTTTVGEAELRLKDVGLKLAYDERVKQIWNSRKREKPRPSWTDCRLEALLEFPPGCEAYEEQLPGDLTPGDKSFVRTCHACLRGTKMKYRASIDLEVAWIAANLHLDNPEVLKAPSRAALSQAIDARLSPKVRESFWRIYWTKRLSPGDSTAAKSKSQSKAFKEDDDSVQEESAAARDEALFKRLWGDEGDSD